MNFHNTDKNMKTYLNFFKKRSLRLKQSSLLNTTPPPYIPGEHQQSLQQRFPKPILDNIYNIDEEL